MAYTFVGITKFVEEAAAKLGLTCLHQLHKAKSGWHLAAVVSALGQLPAMKEAIDARRISPDSIKDSLAQVKLIRDGLAVQLAAIDAAIEDVVKGLGLDADSGNSEPDSGSNEPDSGSKPADSGDSEPPAAPTPVATKPTPVVAPAPISVAQPAKAAAKK